MSYNQPGPSFVSRDDLLLIDSDEDAYGERLTSSETARYSVLMTSKVKKTQDLRRLLNMKTTRRMERRERTRTQTTRMEKPRVMGTEIQQSKRSRATLSKLYWRSLLE